MPNHAAPPRPHKKRKPLITAALVLPLLMAGGAYAYFIANTAMSHVNVENAPSFMIQTAQPTGTPLAPGVGSQIVDFTVANQLTHAQTVPGEEYAVTSDTSGGVYDTVTNAYNDQCLAIWFAIVGDSGTTLPTTLQPGQALSGGTITVTMPNDPNDNQGFCSGVSPQISVTVG